MAYDGPRHHDRVNIYSSPRARYKVSSLLKKVCLVISYFKLNYHVFMPGL